MDWYTKSPSSTTTEIKEKNHHLHHLHHQSKHKKSSTPISPDLHYELLETCCTLMSCTLQFLSHHWMDYVRAAYKLRKTYKKFEQLFEFITGHKASDYAQQLNHRQHHSSPSSTSSSSSSSSTSSSSTTATNTTNFQNNHHHNRKRKKSHKKQHKKHMNHTTTTTTTTTNSNTNTITTTTLKDIFDNDGQEINCIQSGVYFGIGLLSLIFSLLPPKVNKLLNTLGFYSSRPFALQLLQQAYRNKDSMFSSLSALALLAYYTNLSSFAHPKLLPSSLTLTKSRAIVNEIKIKYPHGKIWKLLEGKLYRMEGNLTKSVQVLRDCRRRDSICMSPTLPSPPLLPSSTGTKDYYQHITMTTTFPLQMQSPISELAIQISALSVYEMGWGQIFLGDYFQASETFYRLESMNNWSRAFYHYIATCCLYGDEEYDKAAIDFIQIPRILARRRKNGTRLLANEQFAERTIQQWIHQANQIKKQQKKKEKKMMKLMTNSDNDDQEKNIKKKNKNEKRHYEAFYYRDAMNGDLLKQVVVVNPLWEIIYLWNGMYHVSVNLLQQMKLELHQSIENIKMTSTITQHGCSNIGRLYILLGVVERELGNEQYAETCFRKVIHLEKTCFLDHQHDIFKEDEEDGSSNCGSSDEDEEDDDDDDDDQDRMMWMTESNFKKSLWAGPYAMYEMALLRCLQITTTSQENNVTREIKLQKMKEARDWLRKIDQYHYHYHTNNNNHGSNNNASYHHHHHGNNNSSLSYSDVSCESTCMLLHVRCQLLIEKMDDMDI
ncbi:unnamed protein product [Cunninghamella echinulata]